MTNMNANPFVSTPLLQENENTQMVPVSASAGPNTMQNASSPEKANSMDFLYPEIYWEVFPLVAEVAQTMMARGYNPTSDSIGTIVDNIIKNSGLWYEDEDDDRDPEMLPVQFGFGRMPFFRRRRRFHNRNTLRDLTRILLLRELFDGRGIPFGIF